MTLDQPILLATNNAHKVAEIRAVFAEAGVSVQSLAEAGVEGPEPIEDQPTFEANALIKAQHYARRTDRVCLADDSGLMVDALHGEPGVRSARYAGVEGDRKRVDAANNAKLLGALAAVPDAKRTARFVCVMVLADAQRELALARGKVEGRILRTPRGDNGFGYDPLMHLTEAGRTAAELSPAQKNAISHRGRAAIAMLEQLRQM